LWDRETAECKRTFRGHLNEKNFVGLSVNNGWISCGSETNTLYTYHKSSSIPVTQFRFPRPVSASKKPNSYLTD
jgi:E3 ubiquitin-protein ligase RFWD2